MRSEIRISSLVSKTGILYCLEAVKYYDDSILNTIDEELQTIFKELNFDPGFMFNKAASLFDFLNRVRVEELLLTTLGLWDVPHPWLNLFVPRSRIMDFNQGVFVDIVKNQSESTGPFLVYPINRKNWDDRMSVVIPEDNDDMFYTVALLNSAGGTVDPAVIDKQNNDILEYCKKNGIMIKEYFPHYKKKQEWMKHFGKKWSVFNERKELFDPKKILRRILIGIRRIPLQVLVSADSEDTMNDDTSVGVASDVQEGVTPSVVDMTVEMGKHNSLDDTTVLESFPPSSTPVNTTGNAPGKSSYANITSKPSGKKVNVRTLFTPGGNGIDVVIPVDSIRAVSARFANTAYGFFLGKKVAYPVVANYEWHPDENLLKEDVSTVLFWVKLHGVHVTAFSEDGLSVIATKLVTPFMLDSYTSDICMQSWGRSSYARVLIELRADVKLKDSIVVAMPKITWEGHYTCTVRVEYEWKPPRCSSYKVFKHIHEECLKNTGADENKNKEYRPAIKNSNATSIGNKKKYVEPTIEVSNSNPFDVLNSVDNDVKFGTNGGTTNLVNNGATSSRSSFMNIDNDGKFASHTPIGEKIDKIERQICKGKLRLMDNDGNPLVPSGIVESDTEVEVVFDETANLRISTSGKDESDKGYGTNSLSEQWRDSYPDNDNYDPYDDDMYENHDLSEHLQSICNDLDITVRVKLSDASKKLGTKFATGAFIVMGPTEKDQIGVQGDIVYDIVDFITHTWPDVPKTVIYFIEDGKKVPAI
nr:cytokinin dehydrogenase 3-like [Tanacetum cinerariifolium]